MSVVTRSLALLASSVSANASNSNKKRSHSDLQQLHYVSDMLSTVVEEEDQNMPQEGDGDEGKVRTTSGDTGANLFNSGSSGNSDPRSRHISTSSTGSGWNIVRVLVGNFSPMNISRLVRSQEGFQNCYIHTIVSAVRGTQRIQKVPVEDFDELYQWVASQSALGTENYGGSIYLYFEQFAKAYPHWDVYFHTINSEFGMNFEDAYKTVCDQEQCISMIDLRLSTKEWDQFEHIFKYQPSNKLHEQLTALVGKKVKEFTPGDKHLLNHCYTMKLKNELPHDQLELFTRIFDRLKRKKQWPTNNFAVDLLNLPLEHVADHTDVYGHTFIVAGHTPTSVIAKNTWGEDWGIQGMFSISFEWLNALDNQVRVNFIRLRLGGDPPAGTVLTGRLVIAGPIDNAK